MLISATHTHSAPSAMGALGTPARCRLMPRACPPRIAEAIERAAANLEPAQRRLGGRRRRGAHPLPALDPAARPDDRRPVRRPHRPGQHAPRLRQPRRHRPVRPGRSGSDGPRDPVSIRAADRRAGQLLDALFRRVAGLGRLLRPVRRSARPADRRRAGVEPPVRRRSCRRGPAATSSGWTTASPKRPRPRRLCRRRSPRSADRGLSGRSSTTTTSRWRWPRPTLDARAVACPTRPGWPGPGRSSTPMGDRDHPAASPRSTPRRPIYLHDEPERELKLQAIRIGDLGITAIPNEVYAITGLKIKAPQPACPTMNIELANGSEGYIPPPEQHALGGYTTWPARTAGLEVQAEPKIVDGRAGAAGAGRRQAPSGRRGATARPTPRPCWPRRPSAFWRLDDIEGTAATDASGHGRNATFRGGYALYLPGPDAPGLGDPRAGGSRAAYLAGRRLRSRSTGCQRLIRWNSGAAGSICRPRSPASGITTPWCATAGRSGSSKTALHGCRPDP